VNDPAKSEGAPCGGASEPPGLYAELAADLKFAHATVARCDVDEDRKAVLVRRLLVITDTAKHDLGDAARRLAKFLDDLDNEPGVLQTPSQS
jgi:hypothetical protein